MSIRRILQLGDPVLRKISQSVAGPFAARPVVNDLRDTLHEFQRTHGFGRGISAVQIGAPDRIIYIEINGGSWCFVNPEFEYMSPEKFKLWDDCFSFPDLLVWLERSKKVRVRYQDEHGREQAVEATGSFSELLQHEMDHLDGVLAIDRALDRNSLCTRDEWQRQHSSEPSAAHAASNK